MEQPTPDAAAQPQPEAQNPAPTMSDTVESAHTSSPAAQTTTPLKHVHSLVIDANAIIRNDPTLSTLLAQAEELYTIPAVVSESTPTMHAVVSYEALLTRVQFAMRRQDLGSKPRGPHFLSSGPPDPSPSSSSPTLRGGPVTSRSCQSPIFTFSPLRTTWRLREMAATGG
jgi:hypothetical protein